MNKTFKHISSMVAITFFIILALGSSDDESKNSSYYKMLAYNTASEYVKLELKSPSSAKFPGLTQKSNHVIVKGDGEFKISSWVESKNSFGVMIRSNWSCKAIIGSNDKVKISNLAID